jgi:hypothetical protein
VGSLLNFYFCTKPIPYYDNNGSKKGNYKATGYAEEASLTSTKNNLNSMKKSKKPTLPAFGMSPKLPKNNLKK